MDRCASRDVDVEFDLVVVGGGMGGLATAALAQRVGLSTALLEAHTKLGGCAGYFRRGDCGLRRRGDGFGWV